MFLIASLVLQVISVHKFLIHVFGNSIVCIPISVLKTSVVIGSDLKLGPVCNAGCICSRHQCCLNLTWKGLGIMLMTLSGWFDLVLGLDVTM